MFSANTSQVAAGGGGASNYIEDVFSTYLYTGNGSSQVIENGINLGASNSGGSAYIDNTGYLDCGSQSAYAFGTGNFTINAWIFPTSIPTFVSIMDTRGTGGDPGWALAMDTARTIYLYSAVGFSFAVTSASGAIPLNAWSYITVTRSGSTYTLYINAVSAGTGSGSQNFTHPALTIGYSAAGGGERYYGYISNAQVIKGTAVVPTLPTAPLTAVSGTSLLTCQGPSPFVDNSTNGFAITVNGTVGNKSFGPFTSATAGKGGLVWTKARDITISHALSDTVNGGSKYLQSNTTGINQISGATTFNTTGYTLTDGGGRWNSSGSSYVSWSFQEKQKFFDIVTYTGNFSTQNITHNLGSVPACILIKSTSTVGNWTVYHQSLGNTKYLRLNLTDAETTDSTVWDSTTPTSSVFTVGASNLTNENSGTFTAFIFAHNAGGFGLTGTDNVISCGSFTTDGSSNATITLGYEPQWVLTKRTDGGGGAWGLYDTMRGWSFSAQNYLLPNDSGAEGTINSTNFKPTATGFTVGSPYDASATYIYIAIRRGPMAVPTLGTSVFDPEAYTGTSATRTITSGFPVDLSISKIRSQNYPGGWFDRLRGALQVIRSSSTDPEATSPDSLTGFDSNTGVILGGGGGGRINTSPDTYAMWNFRRAPSFFDEVCYTGTGVARTVTHNLTVAPELMIIKSRSAADSWPVYAASVGNTKYAELPYDTGFATNSSVWNNTSPTSSVFTVGTGPLVNDSGATFVAYLFATCAGVSKVGSYTGNGSTQTINCGFTGGARFVLIKRADYTPVGDWYVYDTARGMTTLTDPYLLLNSTAAETATLGSVTTVSTGFAVNAAILAAINTNAASYIFLAIA